MDDNKLAADEARRLAQRDVIKSEVEHDVSAEVANQTDRSAIADDERTAQLAGEFRAKAVDEVVDTEREVERSRVMARISQVIDYVFYLIYGLLAIRLLLALLAARSSAGFTQFIFAVTDPFYAPFRGIVSSPTAEGGHTLALPIVIALVVYILLHAAINGLLRLLAHRKTRV